MNYESSPETRFVVQVGTESFPIHGSAHDGWQLTTTAPGALPGPYRYTSIDEVIFVLINFSVATDGRA